MIDCVLIQWLNVNDRDYNNPAKYIVLNNNYQVVQLPIIGLSEDLEVLVKYQPFEIPIYDTRLVLLQVIQKPVNEFHPDHTNNNQWLITYEVNERSNDDKKISIDESEQDANLLVFPTRKQLKYLLLYTALTRRESLGLTISPEQQLILDKGDAIAAKLWNNHIESLNKKSLIDENQEINLDENWQTDEE